jgi:hypothetical protein
MRKFLPFALLLSLALTACGGIIEPGTEASPVTEAPSCTPGPVLPYPYWDCTYDTHEVWPGPTGGGAYYQAGEIWTCPASAQMPDPLCMTIEGTRTCCPLWARGTR